jgi:hypothetical protein
VNVVERDFSQTLFLKWLSCQEKSSSSPWWGTCYTEDCIRCRWWHPAHEVPYSTDESHNRGSKCFFEKNNCGGNSKMVGPCISCIVKDRLLLRPKFVVRMMRESRYELDLVIDFHTLHKIEINCQQIETPFLELYYLGFPQQKFTWRNLSLL